MADLVDIHLLIDVCREQVLLAKRLSPDQLPIELLNQSAAALGCLLPRLPDSVLELVINEVAQQLDLSSFG